LVEGEHLIWEITVSDSYAAPYRASALGDSGAVAQMAETRKRARYADLMEEYIFVPIAFETTGKFGKEALRLTKRLGGL
jgi:hypothetical protein